MNERSATVASAMPVATEGSTNNETSDEEATVNIGISYDCGWQRRGGGKAYNSLTGVGHAFGVNTKTIVAYGFRSKTCRICSAASGTGKPPRDHDCRKNWEKSSKAMEGDIAVDIVRDIDTSEQNVNVSLMVGDDDSTAISKVRSEVDDSIEKWSDVNHAKKNLGNKLHQMKTVHKQLSEKVIKAIQKDYAYAMAQNKGNAEQLATTFRAIPCHLFGDHSLCSDWCGFKAHPDTYKHSNLPYGKDLKGEALERDLKEFFNGLAKNASKLANHGSSQVNESQNNVMASKAPKARHYGGSEALTFRVASAVLQTNVGKTYVADVCKEAGLSPGTHCLVEGERQERRRQKSRTRKSTKEFKRRRLFLAANRSSQTASQELCEGTAYSSGISFTGSDEADTVEIPQPVFEPSLLPLQHTPEHVMVCVDLETSGRSAQKCEICQVAATYGTGSEDKCFNQYILPTGQIEPGASSITGITIGRRSGSRVLLKDGKLLPSSSLEEGLQALISWLPSNSVLVAHNLLSFDAIVLLRHLHKSGLATAFQHKVVGLADSLLVLRSAIPGRASYALSSLMGETSFEAHNATGDVSAMVTVFSKLGVTEQTILQEAKTTASHFSRVEYLSARAALLPDIKAALCQASDRVISDAMAAKIAGSGLSLRHLALAFKRDRQHGIERLFTQVTEGKVRVTKQQRIIAAVTTYFLAKQSQ